jgi:hypothetical protein
MSTLRKEIQHLINKCETYLGETMYENESDFDSGFTMCLREYTDELIEILEKTKVVLDEL